jgi:hypothetical protein
MLGVLASNDEAKLCDSHSYVIHTKKFRLNGMKHSSLCEDKNGEHKNLRRRTE